MDFDDAKENIQPLAVGRNARRLEVAIGAENDQSILESMMEERRQLEEAIETYTGDDPLEAWFDLIFWIEQSYPKSGKQSALEKVILKCITTFEKDERYFQDRRMVKIYIKYIDSMENPHEYYEALYKQGVGTMVADLYLCWAYYYDACDNFPKAEEVYCRGMDARAQPLEELENAQKHFYYTISQRILYKDEDSRKQFNSVLEERRHALTSLRAHKRKHVGSQRTGAAIKSHNPGKVVVKEDSSSNRNNPRRVQIYDDENENPNSRSETTSHDVPPLATPVSVVRSLIDSARKSENKREAGPWSNAKSAQKGPLFQDEIQPTFDILEDSDPKIISDIEPIRLPANFVAKNRPQTATDYAVFVDEGLKDGVIATYDKIMMYPFAGHVYSVEELAGYRWMKKRNIQNDYTVKMDTIWSDAAPFRPGPQLPKTNRPQPHFQPERYVVDETIDMSRIKFMFNLDSTYPGNDELSIEEIWQKKLECGELQLHEETPQMNATRIASEAMDETCVVMGRQSVYVPRKSTFPLTIQIVSDSKDTPNIEVADRNQEQPQQVKQLHFNQPHDDPTNLVENDFKTPEAFSTNVFKIPDILPTASEFVIFEDFPDVDDDQVRMQKVILSPDAEETCTAQMFNQHINALAISTPMSSHYADRHSQSPFPRSDVSKNTNPFPNDFDTPPMVGQRPQLSTIMETTEYSKTNSKFSSIETQTSTESEAEHYQKSKHFVVCSPENETDLRKPHTNVQQGVSTSSHGVLCSDEEVVQPSNKSIQNSFQHLMDQQKSVQGSFVRKIDETKCAEENEELKKTSLKESPLRTSRLLSFRESEQIMDKTDKIIQSSRLVDVLETFPVSLPALENSQISADLKSNEIINQELFSKCEKDQLGNCSADSNKTPEMTIKSDNQQIEEDSLKIPEIYKKKPDQSRQYFPEDTPLKSTVDFTFLKSDSQVGRMKGDTVTSFAWSEFLETPRPPRREIQSTMQTPKLPPNFPGNFDDDDFMNQFVMSPLKGAKKRKQIKKPKTVAPCMMHATYSHAYDRPDIEPKLNVSNNRSSANTSNPLAHEVALNKSVDTSFPKLPPLENSTKLDDSVSFKFSPLKNVTDMMKHFELDGTGNHFEKETSLPKWELSSMSVLPLNLDSPPTTEKKMILTQGDSHLKLDAKNTPKSPSPDKIFKFASPNGNVKPPRSFKCSPVKAPKYFMSPIKPGDQSAYSLLTPMRNQIPQESTIFIDENDFMRNAAMPHSTLMPCAETPRPQKFLPTTMPPEFPLKMMGIKLEQKSLNNSILQQFNEIKERSVHYQNTSFCKEDLEILDRVKNIKFESSMSENEEMDIEDERYVDMMGKSIYEPMPARCSKRDEVWIEPDKHPQRPYQKEIDLDQSRFILKASNPDPFCLDLKEAHLVSIDFLNYINALPQCELVQNVPRLVKGMSLCVADVELTIVKWVGEGAFGSVFCGKCHKTGKILALKQERPCNLWEYYILLELQSRILNADVISGFMEARCTIIGNNASIIVSDYHKHGNLLMVCNKFKLETGRTIDEYIAMVLTSQILTLLDNLHAANIIHNDIKPDNFLLTKDISYNEKELSIQLIDFGQSIDMQMFPEGQQFTSSCATEGFVCTEMIENRPWSFQTDLYCLAVTIHVLLFGRYMEVKKGPMGWMHTSKMPRYFHRELWENIFTDLLNIPDCKVMPNLQTMRQMLDTELVDREKIVRDKIREFNMALSY